MLALVHLPSVICGMNDKTFSHLMSIAVAAFFGVLQCIQQLGLLVYLITQLDFLLLPQPEQRDFGNWKLIPRLMSGIVRRTLLENA